MKKNYEPSEYELRQLGHFFLNHVTKEKTEEVYMEFAKLKSQDLTVTEILVELKKKYKNR